MGVKLGALWWCLYWEVGGCAHTEPRTWTLSLPARGAHWACSCSRELHPRTLGQVKCRPLSTWTETYRTRPLSTSPTFSARRVWTTSTFFPALFPRPIRNFAQSQRRGATCSLNKLNRANGAAQKQRAAIIMAVIIALFFTSGSKTIFNDLFNLLHECIFHRVSDTLNASESRFSERNSIPRIHHGGEYNEARAF